MVHGMLIACRKHGLKHDNSTIEREDQCIKTREKTMRGFKNHISCKRFLDMLDIMHNFIKPSIALRCGYPAEEAESNFPWKGIGSYPYPNLSKDARKRRKTRDALPTLHQPNSRQNPMNVTLI
jgi:hypothetical protein